MIVAEMDRPQPVTLDRLLAVIRERREEFSEAQQISADVVELMREVGIYRAMVAKRFGGEEMAPADFLRLIEAISAADGSAGWVASFGFSAVYLSSLPLETLEEMYADGPNVIFAGGIFPPQKALPVEGGLQVSGRWAWGSGSTSADLIGVGIKVEGGASDGLPLIAVMPASKVTIARNWDVIGLKGTGSHDMVVENVVVPPEWTFVRGSPSSLDTPLYRYPSMALAAQVLAVVALGVARASLDFMRDLASKRTSITGAPTLSERAYVQSDLAKAEATLRSARAFMFEATEEAYGVLLRGGELRPEQFVLLRLAATNAARAGAAVTQDIYRLSGTTGIVENHPIARHMQDAMIVTQHAFLSDMTWQNAGRSLLGLPCPPGFP
jgi:alkylation response protein AidB-like acyl-CoA dehydrogenase